MFLSRVLFSSAIGPARRPSRGKDVPRFGRKPRCESLEGRMLLSAIQPLGAADAPASFSWQLVPSLTVIDPQGYNAGGGNGNVYNNNGNTLQITQDTAVYTLSSGTSSNYGFSNIPTTIEPGTTYTIDLSANQGLDSGSLQVLEDSGPSIDDQIGGVEGTQSGTISSTQGTFTFTAPTSTIGSGINSTINYFQVIEYASFSPGATIPVTVYFYQLSSASMSSGAPTLTAPTGTQATTQPTFQWTAASNAPSGTTYELQVYEIGPNSTLIPTPVIDQTGLTGTTYTPPAANTLLPFQYQAVVIAYSNSIIAQGIASNKLNFTIQSPTAPVFSSDPGAPKTIYLDFVGHFDSVYEQPDNNSFAYNILTSPLDYDGNYTTFDAGEQQAILKICAEVAEAYQPFNVNVTTVDPVSQPAGTVLTVVLGDQSPVWTGVSNTDHGQTAPNAFTQPKITIGGKVEQMPSTSFVFVDGIYGKGSLTREDVIARTAIHESGHAFGLNHQVGLASQPPFPSNAGNSDLAPIMQTANSFSKRAVWWDGPSDNPTQPLQSQDDWQILGLKLGLRDDEVGHDQGEATALTLSNNQFSSSGKAYTGDAFISSMNTFDWYSFTTGKAGKLTVSLTVPAASTLRAEVVLFNHAGKIEKTVKAGTNLAATLKDHDLPAGKYYLRVKSFGFEKAPIGRGKDAPGKAYNLGSYLLSGSV